MGDPEDLRFESFDDEERLEEWDGLCQGCAEKAPVSDLGLCSSCAAKLERDLIRKRDWSCSSTAFGADRKGREALRREVIRNYGVKFEFMLEPPAPAHKKEKK